MLSPAELHDYQNRMIQYVVENRNVGLWLGLGMGKTVITLTAISELIDDLAANKILIIAPLRVANTVWKAEAENWQHLQDLKIVICTGTAKERLKALKSEADVYVINRENVQWLVEKSGVSWCWDTLVIDESTSFKTPSSKRFKALKKVLKHVDNSILLSGTPSSNGLMDLWSQIFILDRGDRLCKTITNFRNMYFNPAGFGGYGFKLKKGADTLITQKISDVTTSMRSRDYLELPARIDVIKRVELPEPIIEQYNQLKDQFFLALDDTEIEAINVAALGGKLTQFCNGAIYDSERKVTILHDEKISALRDILEDQPNETFIVAYNYKHDLMRLRKAFPEGVVMSKSGAEVALWNEGKIKLLFLHPASAGHGLNLQKGGCNIIWFGLTFDMELYEQLNGRLDRQGQTRPVTVTHLIVKGGMDEKIMAALRHKVKSQSELLEFLKFNCN